MDGGHRWSYDDLREEKILAISLISERECVGSGHSGGNQGREVVGREFAAIAMEGDKEGSRVAAHPASHWTKWKTGLRDAER